MLDAELRVPLSVSRRFIGRNQANQSHIIALCVYGFTLTKALRARNVLSNLLSKMLRATGHARMVSNVENQYDAAQNSNIEHVVASEKIILACAMANRPSRPPTRGSDRNFISRHYKTHVAWPAARRQGNVW